MRNKITEEEGDAFEWYCPLIKEECMGNKCSMWIFTEPVHETDNTLRFDKTNGCCGFVHFTHLDSFELDEEDTTE